MDYADVLRNTDIFQELAEDELRLVSVLCARESYDTEAQLSREGDEIGKLYVVEEGRVLFQIETGWGRLWSVDSCSRGECFGWAALLEPAHTWASAARCVEPTRLITIDAAGVRELCRSYPHIGFVVMSGIARLTSRRLDNTRRQLAQAADQAG